MVEEPAESGCCGLGGEMVAMNRAQQKSAQALVAAKHQHVPRVREFARQVLDLLEMTVKPLLQLRQ